MSCSLYLIGSLYYMLGLHHLGERYRWRSFWVPCLSAIPQLTVDCLAVGCFPQRLQLELLFASVYAWLAIFIYIVARSFLETGEFQKKEDMSPPSSTFQEKTLADNPSPMALP